MGKLKNTASVRRDVAAKVGFQNNPRPILAVQETIIEVLPQKCEIVSNTYIGHHLLKLMFVFNVKIIIPTNILRY